MKKILKTNLLISIVKSALLLALCAPPLAAAKDFVGSEDHPLLDRYPDTTITSYKQIELEDYVIPLGPPKKAGNQGYVAEQSKTVRGKLTRIVYRSEKDASTLQIFENYIDAMSQPGFELTHECRKLACETYAKFYARGMGQTGVRFKDHTDTYYAVGRYQKPEQPTVYLVLLVGIDPQRRGVIALNVIESKSIELGKVTSNADALFESLMQTGRAQVYDIFFDTGKSTIKPASENALSAIMEVLQKHPDLNLYVVGHTDDTGTLAINNKLSQSRADAVVKALVTRGISDRKRLHGKGVGPFAPVASNADDAGRAKNRRVELVRRLQ